MNPNVVLRGGFGIIYFNTLESPLGQGFSSSTGYVATLDNTHPANSLTNPFPTGINLPTGSSLGLATQNGQSITFPDQNHTQPKIMQYSVSVQTQLPANLVLQIAYVGNKASQLEINKSINALPAQYYNQGAAGVTFLQTAGSEPDGRVAPHGSSLNSATVQRQFLLLPYPEFTNVTDNYASRGNVLPNSLQTSVVKRVSHGFSMQGNFTWSKIMDQNIYLNTQDPLEFALPLSESEPEPGRQPCWDLSVLISVRQAGTGAVHVGRMAGQRRASRAEWQASLATPGASTTSGGNVTPLSNPRLSNATYGRYFNTCCENTADAGGDNDNCFRPRVRQRFFHPGVFSSISRSHSITLGLT